MPEQPDSRAERSAAADGGQPTSERTRLRIAEPSFPGRRGRNLLRRASAATLLISSACLAGGTERTTARAPYQAREPQLSEWRTIYVSAVGKDGKVLVGLKREEFA